LCADAVPQIDGWHGMPDFIVQERHQLV
jgi:hypothetical protein